MFSTHVSQNTSLKRAIYRTNFGKGGKLVSLNDCPQVKCERVSKS